MDGQGMGRRGCMARARLPRMRGMLLAVLGVLGLVITACGGTTRTRAERPATSAACVAVANPDVAFDSC